MIGALIGKQKGRNIEVMNSFELHFDAIDKDVVIDMEYYNTKEEQCKKLVLSKIEKTSHQKKKSDVILNG